MSASLNDWADRLQEQPLPAMPLTIQRITRLIARPSTTNADYQRVIGSDPGFTLSIFRRFVDTGLTPREPVTTPAHGIALLGQAPVIDGIRLPRLQRPAPGGGSHGIYRCYAQAVHAAWYVRHWGQTRGESNPDEMEAAALLHHVGEMALWSSAREEMRKIASHEGRGLSSDDAALEVLGFTLGQLSLALAGRWGLSPLAQAALRPFGAFQPRALAVMLAAALARSTARAWDSEQTRELLELVAERQHLTPNQATAMVHRQAVELARGLQGQPLPVAAFDLISSVPASTRPEERETETAAMPSATPADTPVAAVGADRPEIGANGVPAAPSLKAIQSDLPIPDTGSGEEHPVPPPPAEADENGDSAPSHIKQRPVPLPKRGERVESTAATVPSTQAQLAAGNPESPPEERTIIDNLPPVNNSPPPEQQPAAAGLGTIRRADATPPKSKDLALQQSISLTMRGLRDSASMDRAMFAMLTPDRKTLRARFVIGADKRAAIRRFQLNVEQRHLFSLLLTKPQEFWLNSGNQEKYLPLIPRSLHTTLDTRGFFVTSVFVRNRPLGILYGDCNDAGKLDTEGFARFKQLTQRLSNELGQGH